MEENTGGDLGVCFYTHRRAHVVWIRTAATQEGVTLWGRMSGRGKGEAMLGKDESPAWTSGATYEEREQEKRSR